MPVIHSINLGVRTLQYDIYHSLLPAIDRDEDKATSVIGERELTLEVLVTAIGALGRF